MNVYGMSQRVVWWAQRIISRATYRSYSAYDNFARCCALVYLGEMMTRGVVPTCARCGRIVMTSSPVLRFATLLLITW